MMDTSEVAAFAAQLAADAAGIDADVDAEFGQAAERIAKDQRRRVRKRSRETEKAIAADRVGPAEYLIGADNYQAERLEVGTSRTAPYPWAFDGADEAAGELARTVARNALERRGL